MSDLHVCQKSNASSCYLLSKALSDDTLPLDARDIVLRCPMAMKVAKRQLELGRDGSIGSLMNLFLASKSGCHNYLDT